MNTKKISVIILFFMLIPIFLISTDKIYATSNFDKGVRELTENLINAVENEFKTKYNIAVLDFPVNNKITDFSTYLAENMIINLINRYDRNFRVIERGRLNSILKEHNLSASGILKEEEIKKIGNLIGADVIIMGRYYNLDNNILIIAKIVSVKSGNIFNADKKTIKKDEIVRGILGEELNKPPEIKINKKVDKMEVTLSGLIEDKNDNIDEVAVDWGDGDSDTITDEFDNLVIDHKYSSSGQYRIEVIAVDDRKAKAEENLKIAVKKLDKIKFKMVTVPGGRTSGDENIIINYDLKMSKYEVTHAQYIKFLNDTGVARDGSYKGKELIDMGDKDCAVEYDGSSFYFAGSDCADNEDCPVMLVTWYGAVAYCNWLSEKKGLNKAYDLNNWELKDIPTYLDGYRLPTVDEWEYAARGGAAGETTKYSGSNNIDEVGWYLNNSGDKSHPVGEKQANELGIYDMSGNVWEWTNTPVNSHRVILGGSWLHHGHQCRLDFAGIHIEPSSNFYHSLGFRPCRIE